MSQATPSDIERLRELMRGIKFAMLTTVENVNGRLSSRPMTLQESEFDGDLWFIIGKSSSPACDIIDNPQVNLAFSDAKNIDFISIQGEASILFDKEKIKELWNPVYKAWFKGGVDDPDLALLKVKVQTADCWTAPSSKLVRLVGFATAAITGQRSGLGEREHFDINNMNRN